MIGRKFESSTTVFKLNIVYWILTEKIDASISTSNHTSMLALESTFRHIRSLGILGLASIENDTCI